MVKGRCAEEIAGMSRVLGGCRGEAGAVIPLAFVRGGLVVVVTLDWGEWS